METVYGADLGQAARAQQWQSYLAIQPRARRAGSVGEPVTATGGEVAALLRAGLPDMVVYRRAGAASVAAVRAYRARLIGRGENVPSAAEALRRWQNGSVAGL